MVRKAGEARMSSRNELQAESTSASTSEPRGHWYRHGLQGEDFEKVCLDQKKIGTFSNIDVTSSQRNQLFLFDFCEYERQVIR